MFLRVGFVSVLFILVGLFSFSASGGQVAALHNKGYNKGSGFLRPLLEKWSVLFDNELGDVHKCNAGAPNLDELAQTLLIHFSKNRWEAIREAPYLIELSWKIRAHLNDQISFYYYYQTTLLENTCLVFIRRTLRVLRLFEEQVGELFLSHSDPIFGTYTSSQHSDYLPLTGKFPWVLRRLYNDTLTTVVASKSTPKTQKGLGSGPASSSDRDSGFTIRSGDILISRGERFVSAAIAQIGVEDTDFSHLSIIFIEGDDAFKELPIEQAIDDPRVKVIEAFIEQGSVIRPFSEYLKSHMSRLALFRTRSEIDSDGLVADRAARFIHQRVKDYHELHHENLPYDFHMNLFDQDEIFCSEIGFWAFASQGMRIPTFPTRVVSGNNLADTLQIPSGPTFLPADMELDPRFKQIAEWRNFEKVRVAQLKDVVVGTVFNWMEQRQYSMYFNFGQVSLAKLALFLRNKVGIFKKEVSPNMTELTIQTVLHLERLGKILLDSLVKQDESFEQKNIGRSMTLQEAQDFLEQLRQQDFNLWINWKKFYAEGITDEDLNRSENPKDFVVARPRRPLFHLMLHP